MWPAFAVGLLVDPILIGGDAAGALLEAAFFQIIVVAVLAPLGGLALRRARPDLPRIVAADYAGAALLVAVTAALLAANLAG